MLEAYIFIQHIQLIPPAIGSMKRFTLTHVPRRDRRREVTTFPGYFLQTELWRLLYFLYFSTCICVYVWTCCTWVGAHVYVSNAHTWRSKVNNGNLLNCSLPYSLVKVSPSNPELAVLASLASHLAFTISCLRLLWPELEVTHHAHLSFTRLLDLNSGPLACAANALSVESSPQPKAALFFLIVP